MAPNTLLHSFLTSSLLDLVCLSALIQSTIINELWHDDFAFDISLSTGWHIYNYKSLNEYVYYNPDPNRITLGLNGKQYHGPFTRVVGGSRSNYLRRQFQCNHSDPTIFNKIFVQYSFAYCQTDNSDYTRICVLNSNVSLNDLDSDVCSLGSHTLDDMDTVDVTNSYSFGDSEFVLNAHGKTGCDITQWRRKNKTVEMSTVIPTHETFTITAKQTMNNGEYSVLYDFSVACVDNETTLSPTLTPSNVPSVTPSNNPITNPTQFPTDSPTYYTSLSPSNLPSLTPSVYPSNIPSVSPSNVPSVSPSVTPSNNPTANGETNNPSQTPIKNPTQFPTYSPTDYPSLNPSDAPSLLPSINPITHTPTTNNPTTNPTTDAPTQTSTDNRYPTVSYTSTALHTTLTDRDDIIFVRQTPKYGSIVSNVYDRFVAMNEFYIKSALNLDGNCVECFEWTVNDLSIHDFYGSNTAAFAVYNHKIDIIIENGIEYDIFESYLIIHSINDESGYHCSENRNTDQKHIFEAGNTYDLKLSVLDNHSEILKIVTNQPPFGGLCEIIDFETLKALDPFNLKCRRWNSDTNASLTYNAAFGNGVLLSNEFIPIQKQISSLVPIGDFEINVLIKDSLDSITCYTMNGSFPSIDQILQDPNSNITASDLVTSIDSIVQNTNLGQNNDVTIALYSVINNIAMGNSSETSMLSELQDLTQNIITNVFNSSLIDYYDPQNNITKDMLGSQLSVYMDMTSNPALINNALIALFVDEYIPLIFNALNAFIDNQRRRRRLLSDDRMHSISDALGRLVNKLQSVFTNLETANNISVYNNDQNDMLMEYALRGVTVALSDSFPGETYHNMQSNNARNATKIISGIKFESVAEANQSVKCGLESENIIIPSIFASENEGIYDCSFVKSAVNNFVPINSSEYHSASNILAINLYSNQDNAIPMEYGTDECNPYLISFVTSDMYMLHTFQNYNFSLNEQTTFPKCNFWDNVLSTWSDEGCYVHNISFEDSMITCACVHLSTFQVSSSDFIPTTNVESIWQLRTFTIQNLLRYPSVFITMLSLFCLIVCSCICSTCYEKEDNTAILAFEDIVFKKVRNDKLRTSDIGHEVDCLANHLPNPKYLGYGIIKLSRGVGAKRSLCRLSLGLYRIYLRNEHTLLSVFVKTEGTNYSAKERLGCFFLYLCTVMCGSAMVYGVTQVNLVGDLSSSFWISLFATGPVLITKKLFLWSKPVVVPRTLQKVESDVEKIKNSFRMKKYRTAMDLATDAKLQRTQTTKLKMVDSVRVELFNRLYPLPHQMKYCAWVFLVIWTIFACFACLQIGLEFDLKYTKKDTIAFGDCWQNNRRTSIETALSLKNFHDVQTDLDEKNSFSDNYNALFELKGVSESVRWLISCLMSVLLSLFVWQPLTIYLVTWLKIVAFSWNLDMTLPVKTLLSLLKLCCRCGNSDETGLKEMLTPQLQCRVSNEAYKTANKNSNVYLIFAHQNRPLDLIGYISNEELFAEHRRANNTAQNGTKHKGDSSSSLSFSENKDCVEIQTHTRTSTTLKPPMQMSVNRPPILEMIQSHSPMSSNNITNLQNGAHVENELSVIDDIVISPKAESETQFESININSEDRSPNNDGDVNCSDLVKRHTTVMDLNAIMLEMDLNPQTEDTEPEISSMELPNHQSRVSANSGTVDLEEMLDICADIADEMMDLDGNSSPVVE